MYRRASSLNFSQRLQKRSHTIGDDGPPGSMLLFGQGEVGVGRRVENPRLLAAH